jgi:chromosomal replication initiator protein
LLFRVSDVSGKLFNSPLSLKEKPSNHNRKDHTTVIHAKKMIENQFREKEDFRIQLEMMIKNLQK